MNRSIDYGKLMHNAMRRLIQEVLSGVAAEGLPGKHHFFITFDTMHPDVEIADWLSDRYPGEMTIVLQHQFWDLEVSDDTLDLTLSFNKVPERLIIPFEAMTGFADPSVQFGLQFQPDRSRIESPGEDEAGLPAQLTPGGAVISVGNNADDEDDLDDENVMTETPETSDGEKVVALDQFRKK